MGIFAIDLSLFPCFETSFGVGTEKNFTTKRKNRAYVRGGMEKKKHATEGEDRLWEKGSSLPSAPTNKVEAEWKEEGSPWYSFLFVCGRST